jgi:hypothetical protein
MLDGFEHFRDERSPWADQKHPPPLRRAPDDGDVTPADVRTQQIVVECVAVFAGFRTFAASLR